MKNPDYNLKPVEFDPFAGPEIEKAVPSTEPQAEIWASYEIGGEDANRSYNESVSLVLHGNLDYQTLERAFQTLVMRHEALRSGFSSDGKQLCIFTNSTPGYQTSDLSADTQEEQQRFINNFLHEDAQTSFDLLSGPLFRIALFKISDTEYHLTLSAHHIICDGWSMGVIMQDLGKLYSAYVKGETPALPPAPSFSEYAIKQKEFQFSREYKAIEQFWINQYRDGVPVLDIPTDFPRPEIKTYKSRRDDYTLSTELISSLKKTGADYNCSLVTTLIIAFEVFLHRLSGQHDIVLGVPAAGQSAEGNYGLVGHCVNMLPVRSHHDGELRFNDFLKKRRPEMLDAYENQQLTFGSLLKELNITRDASRVPLIPVVFNIDIGLDEGVRFEGLTHRLIINKREYENFEIFLNATGSGNALTFEWSYNTQLFTPPTIRQMMDGFESLLREITRNPEVKIKDIMLAGADISFEWNDTEAVYPEQMPLHDLIAQKAREYPHKTAFTFRNKTFTYKELNDAANQLAALLLSNGVHVGDRIGVALDRSPEMIISLLAILKAGAAYLPVDPAYPKKQIEYMLTDSSARILITSRAYQGKFAASATEIITDDIWNRLPDYPADDPQVEIKGDDLAYIIYTSGSSGKPKGTLIEHHSVVNFLYSMQKAPGINQDDKLLAVTTISFDIAGLELYLPLITGAEILLADAEAVKDGRTLLDLVRSEKITVMQATPSTWRMMLDAGWDSRINMKALCGGEALPKDLANNLLGRCAALWNMYGPTETTIWSSVKQITNPEEFITIGRPIANTQIYILDQYLKPVPRGGTGEIYIAGAGLARGYLNKPDLTSAAFIANPFTGGDHKMYRTGDLGKFMNNNEIQCLGRVDNQVKLRGHRIELSAIEDCLNMQETIKQAVVIAREDIPGDKRLAAYVVPDINTNDRKAPSWYERWEDLYTRGIQSESNLDLAEQQLDIAVAQQISGRSDIRTEVEEWLGQSVNRIKALHAKNIMEVGCGGGQLVFELAPLSEHFLATDYSQTAIDKLQEKLSADPAKWRNVRTLTAPADDFSFVDSPLDLVIINGVVQYFPDATYLLKVITEAAKVIRDGGCIYIGDMQGKNTLEMYHAFDQLQRSDDNLTLSEFKNIVNRRVQLEDELVADPAFFYLLPALIPRIAAADVQLRTGKHVNETTKYHYDIWLYVNAAPPAVKPDIIIEWQPSGNIEQIEKELEKYPSKVVQISRIFNSRTAADYSLQSILKELGIQTPVKDVRKKLEENHKGINPDLFWKLGEAKNCNTYVRWSNDGSDGCFDVIFIPETIRAIPAVPEAIAGTDHEIYDFIREPFAGDISIPAEQISTWKNDLKELLPQHMIPSDFVVLRKLPLLPNGKIDRKALPKPDGKSGEKTKMVAPRTAIEKLVAKVWADSLGLETVGLDDDFFELGGHSLIAVQVMIRLEKETGKRLPLTTLFKFSTLEQFAALFSQTV